MKSPGFQLYYSSDNISYTQITLTVLEITPFSPTYGEVEETHLESVSALKEWSAGWGDLKELKFKLKLTAAQYKSLLTIQTARSTYYWRVVAPLQTGESTPMKLTAQGFLRDMAIDTIARSKDEVIMIDITVRASGAITLTDPT